MGRVSAAALLCVLLLGGCGGSSSSHRREQKTTVARAYGVFPAITIPVTSGTPAQCKREAQAFARAAVAFLAPFPSNADTYVAIARLQFLEFGAHNCDVAILRRTLSRHATPAQRKEIVARLPFLGDAGRELTRK